MTERSTEPFEDYLVYRQRLDELIHLHRIWTHLSTCPKAVALGRDHIRTYRLVVAGHFAGFFDPDPRSLDVFKLWKKHFPHMAAEIRKWQKQLKPMLKKLKKVRDTSAAHAELSIDAQNEARQGIPAGELRTAVEHFIDYATETLKAEKGDPGLAEAVNEWGFREGHS